MGVCLSAVDDDEEEAEAAAAGYARYRSRQIDKHLHRMAAEDRNTVKILLLGAAESGKSTLVKQMKIIHNDGFTKEELVSFRRIILDNLVSSMKYVLNGMGLLRVNLENPRNKCHAHTILSCHLCYDEFDCLLPFVSHALRQLWGDGGVRRCAGRGHEYELNDSALYYFTNLDRICHPHYIPTATDVLRARVRTSGIIETCFCVNNITFRMFDVGGQRSERRKWIQCFDDVRAIMFIVALSGYDMTLYEDANVNRLEESFDLFSQICNNRFFITTSMVLFLNKLDLFRDKILYSGRHLVYYFPDYRGSVCNVEQAAQYIQCKFLSMNRNPHKLIYPHFTTATDTTNIQFVFQVAMDAIIRENLSKAQLL